VQAIRDFYQIEPGGVDLACFPLFGLFSAAMGVATVFPDMDFSRPATACAKKLLVAAHDWGVTQAFASPTVWDNLSRYCMHSGDRIGTLRSVFSCGAPVPARVLSQTLEHLAGDGAQMHTPYGATEALPVASIEAQIVLCETAAKSLAGSGVCVGRPFESITWHIVRITDRPIVALDDAEFLPPGEIGELIVRGPQVSRTYVTRIECNLESKIVDEGAVWHRMGDVGYLDDQQRFWYCGRKSQRVVTSERTLYTAPVEGVFDAHPDVDRSALTGCGPVGNRTPVVYIERPHERGLPSPREAARIVSELRTLANDHEATQGIERFIFTRSMPVDIRHNAKINREQLAEQAQCVYEASASASKR
jgi:acyl-CoA synthetase (AMP-forming)/AMP-acid ligase II